MFERFTSGARDAVRSAQETARELGHEHIGSEHLLLGVLDDVTVAAALADVGVERPAVLAAVTAMGGWDAEALAALGVDLAQVRRRAEAAFGPGALDAPTGRTGRRWRRTGGHLPLTAGARRALTASLHEAVQLRDAAIGTDHLLLGLLADDRDAPVAVLRRLVPTLDPAALRAAVRAGGRAA